MEMIGFLILFPLVVAALLLIFRQNKVRNAIVWVASIVIMGASIAFVAMNIGTPGKYFLFESVVVDWASIAISVIVGAIVIFYSVKYRRFWCGPCGHPAYRHAHLRVRMRARYRVHPRSLC